MSENSAPLLVITGPTGIGKTQLAMALSDQAPLALISADSVMVYQDLNIGSAKPSPIELAQYPHALVDLVPPEHPFDAGQFVLHAETAIAKAWNEGMIPCLVGGTIMYLKALLDGLDQLPEADPKIRAQIRAVADRDGWPAAHQWLASLDAEMAAQIHPNHSTRIERALEVYLLTGQSIQSHWTGQPGCLSIDGKHVGLSIITLWPASREQLKTRLDQRFMTMLERGLLDEVRALKERPDLSDDCPSMRSVGYRQVWSYLDGEIDHAGMIAKAQAATRQLAKRQLTWLRSWRVLESQRIEVADQLPVDAAVKWFKEMTAHVF